MNHQTARGSAQVIIIASLAVALVAALGVVFYQNFIAKDSADDSETSAQGAQRTSDQTSDVDTVTLVDGSIDSSFETGFSFKYPSTWKRTQTMSGIIEPNGTWQQLITLTSPSGKYVVSYNVGANGGIGGTCIPEETGTIASTAYEVVSSFSGMSYIELTYKDMPADVANTERAAGVIMLVDTENAKGLQVGDSACETAFHGVVTLNEAKYVALLSAKMVVTGATTEAQLKDALSGAEYEQGKAILLSTTH